MAMWDAVNAQQKVGSIFITVEKFQNHKNLVEGKKYDHPKQN